MWGRPLAWLEATEPVAPRAAAPLVPGYSILCGAPCLSVVTLIRRMSALANCPPFYL
jgi:hypothetical protein